MESLVELIIEFVLEKLSFFIGSRINNKGLRFLAYVLVFVLLLVAISVLIMLIAIIESEFF